MHASFHSDYYFCQENKLYINLLWGLRSVPFLQGEEFCLEQEGSNDPFPPVSTSAETINLLLQHPCSLIQMKLKSILFRVEYLGQAC